MAMLYGSHARGDFRADSDWDTRQIKLKTEMTSLANGGPQSFRIAVKPVDYKGRELSNLMNKEFSSHHQYDLSFV